LAIEQPTVSKALREALLASAATAQKMGLKPETRWGDIQVVSSGAQQTAIHGGPGTLGIYNAIQSVPREDGKLEVISGTSYLQVVSFDDKGPHAQGLLAFSLSSDPESKYSRDQTEAFSKNSGASCHSLNSRSLPTRSINCRPFAMWRARALRWLRSKSV
jgi:acyl-homoserine-lactone acylase